MQDAGPPLPWIAHGDLGLEHAQHRLPAIVPLSVALDETEPVTFASAGPAPVVVDFAAAIALSRRRKVGFFVDDPYAQLKTAAAALALREQSRLYERLHFGICNTTKLLAATREARMSLQMRHSQYVGYIMLPPIRWKPQPKREGLFRVVVTTAVREGFLFATQIAAELASSLSDADVQLALPDSSLVEALRQASVGEPGGAAVTADLHVYVGPCSSDCTQLRLCESWLNGIPVVQILTPSLSPTSDNRLTSVTHGTSGLVAASTSELREHVMRIRASCDYAQFLAHRAKSFVMRESPGWQDLAKKLVE